MCGIFCVVKKKGKIDLNKCRKTLLKLNHRGPDWNFYKTFDDKIFMGQTVLSMTGSEKKNLNNHFSKSKNSFLLFNGEIYNYKLINNYFFNKYFSRDFSDTEIFVNLIEKYQNKNFYEYLDGMYAFIFFDTKTKKFLVGRDQGEKIIYYHESVNEIIFFF